MLLLISNPEGKILFLAHNVMNTRDELFRILIAEQSYEKPGGSSIHEVSLQAFHFTVIIG